MTSTVKILNHTYEVYVSDRNTFESPRFGDIRNDFLKIRVDEDIVDQIKLITLVHEILHAIAWQLSIDDLPEPMVRALAHSIAGVFEANGVDLTPLLEIVKNAEKQTLT